MKDDKNIYKSITNDLPRPNIADKYIKNHIKEILTNGISTEEFDNRSKWEDGSNAYTKRIFGVVDVYDLSEQFPVSTLRPLAFKNCIDEILWIHQKKSNKIKDLNSHIWDSWSDDKGTIRKAYGYQIKKAKRCIHEDTPLTKNVPVWYDQTDFVLHEIKHNPTSRRICVDMFNVKDLHNMKLEPCCYNYNIFVDTENKKLNMMLNQRSQDYITANNWNVVQYAILLIMLARSTGYKEGKLIHCITDCHIYNKHFDIAEELLNRPSYSAPTLWVNPEITDFYKFTPDDFKLENYQHGEKIKVPVAI